MTPIPDIVLPAGSPHLLLVAASVVAVGFMLCRVIGGLKDMAWFSDWFALHPQAAMILNATFSLLTAISGCLVMGVKNLMGFTECVLMAVGIFFSAAGFHRKDKRSGPAPPPSGAGPVATAQLATDVVALAPPVTTNVSITQPPRKG